MTLILHKNVHCVYVQLIHFAVHLKHNTANQLCSNKIFF